MRVAVIGNCSDMKLFKTNQETAAEIGRIVAEAGALLLFSIENDAESLPIIAARTAKEHGGVTVGFTHGSETNDQSNASTHTIVTGMQRGGPREFMLISSADIIIAIGGGSGTLMEIAIAYQQDKKIFALKGSGGWAERLSDSFLDGRRRVKVRSITPDELPGVLRHR